MSTYKEEFLRHWQDVSIPVESSIITQLKQTGTVNVEVLNNIIERETSAWKNTFESKGKFITRIREINGKAADEFKSMILEFRLTTIEPPKKPSSVPSLATGAAIGVGAFAVLQFIARTSVWISAIGGVVGLVASNVLLGGGSKDKYMGAATEAFGAYNKQVEARRDALVKLLETLN